MFGSTQASVPVLFAWWAASGAVWLVALNRALSHLPDGIPKRLAMLGALLAFGLAGTAGALAWRGWQGLGVPLAVLAALGVGEIRRTALRRSYAASPPVSVSRAPGGLWRPITTTDLVARRYEIAVPRLPVARLRVAHLSDLHVGGGLPLDYYRSAFELVQEYEPDLLVVTGDLVSRDTDLASLREVLETVVQPRLGGFAVLGNHDHWVSAERVRGVVGQTGFELVEGRCHALGLSLDQDVFVCGDEHPWGPRLDTHPASGTALVLSHTPDNIYTHVRAGVTAVFSGHLHAGQFRLPGLGAVAIPSRHGRRFDHGHFQVGDTHLFVSSGVGGIPLRLWCEPDVFIVDLVADPVPVRG